MITKTELTDDQINEVCDAACELLEEADELVAKDSELDLTNQRVELAENHAFQNDWSQEQEDELYRHMGI